MCFDNNVLNNIAFLKHYTLILKHYTLFLKYYISKLTHNIAFLKHYVFLQRRVVASCCVAEII